MQTGRYTTVKGGTSPSNSTAVKPSGAGDGKHDFYSRRSLKCSYCDEDTYIIKNCYYLNDYPIGHKLHGKNIKPKNKRSAAYTIEKDPFPEHDNKSNERPTCTTEEYNQLIALLHKWPNNFPLVNATSIVTSTCNLTQYNPHSNIYIEKWTIDPQIICNVLHLHYTSDWFVISLNYITDWLQTFNFMQFYPCRTLMSPRILAPFSFWSLVSNLCNLTLNRLLNFQFSSISPMISTNWVPRVRCLLL